MAWHPLVETNDTFKRMETNETESVGIKLKIQTVDSAIINCAERF